MPRQPLFVGDPALIVVDIQQGTSMPAEEVGIAHMKGWEERIANAERGYFATQQKYASLDELISGNYITIERQRPPYTYDVEITPSGFHATATRDTAGGPVQLWIDETMQIKSSN